MMAKDYNVNIAMLYIAFLLHDVGEDTTLFGDRNTLPWWKFVAICTNRVSRLFGPRVAELVVTMTKPGKIDGGWETKDEMMKTYLGKLSGDYHAILLKMIDRLHNLNSLPQDDPKRIEKQVAETRDLLIPMFKKGIDMATKAGNGSCAGPMQAALGDIQYRVHVLSQTKKG